MSRMTTSVVLAIALGSAAPVHADPVLGLGVTIVFGGGQTRSGIGARVFSDDEEDSAVASLGIDYLFQSHSWRPTLGAAYLNNNTYIGADVGYTLGGGGLNFGLSGGAVNTAAPEATGGSTPEPEPEA